MMNTYQVTATIDPNGRLTIPAPLDKAGARLRLTVVWEEDVQQSASPQNRAEAVRRLRGSWRDAVMSVDEWNKHKHQIW